MSRRSIQNPELKKGKGEETEQEEKKKKKKEIGIERKKELLYYWILDYWNQVQWYYPTFSQLFFSFIISIWLFGHMHNMECRSQQTRSISIWLQGKKWKKKNQLMINGSDLFRVVLNWVAWRKMIIIVLSSSEDLLE